VICKGTTHNNGAKLARYMTTGKEHEQAELWQLIGFAAGDIRDAFRSVHVMAEATRCVQPFFHVQVRNPEGEELSRDQWRQVADRVETKLGFSGQARAIAFHIDTRTGHEHMHIAWSRIDLDTLTARPLPFFRERLKEVSRELEERFDLTRVKNERDGPVLAPTRDEFEQARRLGVDAKAIRRTIRDCYERSDCGRSFEAALAEEGLILTQGDRRDFVVVDQGGGTHALGKRILGVSAAQIRDRCTDIDREQLPSVELAREFIRERGGRKKDVEERLPDPHRQELAWLDALERAAIDKETIERRFVEPRQTRPAPELEKVAAAGELTRRAPARKLQVPIPTTRTVERLAAALDTVGSALESLLAPKLTPEQKLEGEVARRARQSEAEHQVDVSRYLNENALAIQRQEQERAKARERDRDDRER
jgi:hypothetical protein